MQGSRFDDYNWLFSALADPAKLVREFFEPLGADLSGFAADCLAEAGEKLKPEPTENCR
jgi:hypothetical protein